MLLFVVLQIEWLPQQGENRPGNFIVAHLPQVLQKTRSSPRHEATMRLWPEASLVSMAHFLQMFGPCRVKRPAIDAMVAYNV